MDDTWDDRVSSGRGTPLLVEADGSRIPDLIADECERLAEARILVSCPNRATIRRVVATLRARFIHRPVHQGPPLEWARDCVVVCSSQICSWPPPEAFGAIVWADAYHASQVIKPRSLSPSFALDHAVAFLPRSRPSNPRQMQRVFQLFGPITESHSGPTLLAAVQVRWLAHNWRTPVDFGSLDWKRRLWHHESRNQLIARVALEQARNAATAILVESVQHGEALASRLPEWTLLHGDDSVFNYRARSALENRWARKIVTTTCASYHVELAPDVLISATGDGSVLHLRQFPPEQLVVGRQVALIDIVDRVNGRPTRTALERRGQFALRSWPQTGLVLSGEEHVLEHE